MATAQDQRSTAESVGTSANQNGADAYGHGKQRPLKGYLMLMGAYGGLLVGLSALAARASPKRRLHMPTWPDLVLAAIAAHKVSRLITKDSITSALRAPWVKYKEPAGGGEVNEEVRAEGSAHALGELLICPMCMDIWTATLAVGVLAIAPRSARLACSIAAVAAGANATHYAWDALKKTES